jgi:uncharacterized BrkB/YihY/UPF0761 family membrane protein
VSVHERSATVALLVLVAFTFGFDMLMTGTQIWSSVMCGACLATAGVLIRNADKS